MKSKLYYEKYPQLYPSSHSYIGILVHGGGGQIWNIKSKPYKYLSSLKICSTIYSIAIPCHGKENIPSDPAIHHGTTIQHLKQFSNTLSELPIDDKKIILICFSLGASFIIKLWNKIIKPRIDYNKSVLIIIGCTPWIQQNKHHKHSKIWYHLWTPNIIKALKMDKRFEKIHGSNWNKMALSVRQWFWENDLIFNDENQCQQFINDDRVFYIIGEYENVYPGHCLFYLMTIKDKETRIAKHVTLIPCGHFTYFNKIGWKFTLNALNNILNCHIIGKQLVKPIMGDVLATNIIKITRKNNCKL